VWRGRQFIDNERIDIEILLDIEALAKNGQVNLKKYSVVLRYFNC
jgi:hypothetical protein